MTAKNGARKKVSKRVKLERHLKPLRNKRKEILKQIISNK